MISISFCTIWFSILFSDSLVTLGLFSTSFNSGLVGVPSCNVRPPTKSKSLLGKGLSVIVGLPVDVGNGWGFNIESSKLCGTKYKV